MFINFTGNIEEMVVDDFPIVKSRASRADYQTSQTTWKVRMEAQDTRWKERRDQIYEESIKSSCINKGALCSLCQNQQAFVRCQTCRYHLCSNCDKTIHTKQVTHQRKCEVNNCLHSLQPTEFLTNEGNLETQSIIVLFHLVVILVLIVLIIYIFLLVFQKFHCQCLFPTDAIIALGLGAFNQ